MKNKRLLLICIFLFLSVGATFYYRMRIFPPIIAKVYYSEQTKVAKDLLYALQKNNSVQIKKLTNESFENKYNSNLLLKLHKELINEDLENMKVFYVGHGSDNNPNQLFIAFYIGYTGDDINLTLEYDGQWAVSSLTPNFLM